MKCTDCDGEATRYVTVDGESLYPGKFCDPCADRRIAYRRSPRLPWWVNCGAMTQFCFRCGGKAMADGHPGVKFYHVRRGAQKIGVSVCGNRACFPKKSGSEPWDEYMGISWDDPPLEEIILHLAEVAVGVDTGGNVTFSNPPEPEPELKPKRKRRAKA